MAPRRCGRGGQVDPAALEDELVKRQGGVGNGLRHLARRAVAGANEVSGQALHVGRAQRAARQVVDRRAAKARADEEGRAAQQRAHLLQQQRQALEVVQLRGQRLIAQASAGGGL